MQFVYNGTKVVKDEDTGEDETVAVTKTETINFQQWNLWRVWSAPNANGVRERYYDIEHEEEYLNNYASDQQYGQTQNGMPWGLEGVQLSNKYEAAVLAQTSGDIITAIINAVGKYIGFDDIETLAKEAYKSIATYYDFYLPRDVKDMNDDQKENLEVNEYCGLEYNKQIALTLKASTKPEAKINGIILTEDPISAFAYCYHKNKRNANGEVVEQKWFLPAIDEIEDIALGAYDEFDKVFQNQMYWSCQPAYDIKKLNLKLTHLFSSNAGYLAADYYNDNINRARATYVYTTDGKNYDPANSGSPKYAGTQNGTANIGWKKLTVDLTKEGGYVPTPISDYSDYEGNLPRTKSCRIRAVYRSGTAN